MIKRFVFCLVVLGIAIGFGVELVSNPGMMLIQYKDMVIRLPLWLALVSFLLFLLLISFLLFLLRHVRGIPRDLRQWRHKRHWHRAIKYFT